MKIDLNDLKAFSHWCAGNWKWETIANELDYTTKINPTDIADLIDAFIHMIKAQEYIDQFKEKE